MGSWTLLAPPLPHSHETREYAGRRAAHACLCQALLDVQNAFALIRPVVAGGGRRKREGQGLPSPPLGLRFSLPRCLLWLSALTERKESYSCLFLYLIPHYSLFRSFPNAASSCCFPNGKSSLSMIARAS